MPGRRRAPHVYGLHVPIGIAQHAVGVQHLLTAFIEHLTYAREQCHAPFSNLQAQVQASRQLQQQQLQQTGRRTRLRSINRRAVKYCGMVEAMIEMLSSIPFAHLAGQSVVVLLGASVVRPREVYCLHLPQDMVQEGLLPPPLSAELLEATRKLMRSLIIQHGTIEEWDSSPGPTKMFLLFSALEGSLQEVPHGFSARHSYSINLRKAFQVNISLGKQPVEAVQDQQWQQHGRSLGKQPVEAVQDQQWQQHGRGLEAAQQPGCHQTGLDAAATDVVLECLSQQMCTHMNLDKPDGADGVPERDNRASTNSLQAPLLWYQCAVHVKGLRPPPAHA